MQPWHTFFNPVHPSPHPNASLTSSSLPDRPRPCDTHPGRYCGDGQGPVRVLGEAAPVLLPRDVMAQVRIGPCAAGVTARCL